MTEPERGPVEVRTATIDRLNAPQRIVELVVVPYDEPAPVEYQGRVVEESFAPGAFGAVHNRTGRLRFLVNLDHDPDRWVGRVVKLDTKCAAGLRAELQIRRTDLGDQVLVDAADGMLAGSVGFAVLPGGEQWEGRNRRRVSGAWLDHVALTASPAYAGADVVDVRSAPVVVTSTTPNLDRILAERAAQSYPPR